MQNEFEFYVYRYECYFSFLLVFLAFAFREPSHIQFVDLFSFVTVIYNGFIATITHGVWKFHFLKNRHGYGFSYIWLLDYCMTSSIRDSFNTVMQYLREYSWLF